MHPLADFFNLLDLVVRQLKVVDRAEPLDPIFVLGRRDSDHTVLYCPPKERSSRVGVVLLR